MNNEYYQLQLEVGLSNLVAAAYFKVSITTIKRWKSGESEAPEAVILCLKSIIQKKPVNKLK